MKDDKELKSLKLMVEKSERLKYLMFRALNKYINRVK